MKHFKHYKRIRQEVQQDGSTKQTTRTIHVVDLMRFLIRSDELTNPGHGLSAFEAERPIIIPSIVSRDHKKLRLYSFTILNIHLPKQGNLNILRRHLTPAYELQRSCNRAGDG